MGDGVRRMGMEWGKGGRWRKRIECCGEVNVPGGVKDGGTSAKNGGEGAKEWERG